MELSFLYCWHVFFLESPFWCWWCLKDQYHCLWCDTIFWSLQSMCCLQTNKMCQHWGAQHTCLCRHFNILHEPNFFLFSFLFFNISKHNTNLSSSPSTTFSAFSFFLLLLHFLSLQSILICPFFTIVVAYSVNIFLFVVIFLCFLILFRFIFILWKLHYLPVVTYILSTFHAKRTSWTSSLAPKFNNMNTFFFIWHVLKKFIMRFHLDKFPCYVDFSECLTSCL